MNELLNRITINKEVRAGKPTIRNMRITAMELLELLASGMTHDQILQDYPYLEKDDIAACMLFAARLADTKSYDTITV